MQELEDSLRTYFGKHVQCIKLITGELVIGFVTNYSDTSFELNFPYQVTGRVIKPYCEIIREKSFRISFDQIIFSKRPTPEFVEVYLEEVVINDSVELSAWLMRLTKELIVASMEADRIVH